MTEMANDMKRNAPVAKNSPTGTQQHIATPNAVEHPDGPGVQSDSDGNQTLREAAKNIQPNELAANLNPEGPDAASDVENPAPFIADQNGKAPE